MPTRSAPPSPPGPGLARGLLGQEACQLRPHFAGHPPRPPSCPPPAKSGVCRPRARSPLHPPPISLCDGGDGERRLLGRGTWTAHRVGDIGGGWSGGVGGIRVSRGTETAGPRAVVFAPRPSLVCCGLATLCFGVLRSPHVPRWSVAVLPRCVYPTLRAHHVAWIRRWFHATQRPS